MPAFIKCLGNSVLTLRQTYSRWSPLLQLFQLFKHLLQGMLFYENLDCYLYSSKLPYIWISPATHLTADLKCCSSSSISCSTHGRLQSWRPCCPCSWSGAFSWIYCTPVPRLLQYMLHCLLSLPRSRLQRYLHLDQPSINWPNICCSVLHSRATTTAPVSVAQPASKLSQTSSTVTTQASAALPTVVTKLMLLLSLQLAQFLSKTCRRPQVLLLLNPRPKVADL